jgi:hypothetical protein
MEGKETLGEMLDGLRESYKEVREILHKEADEFWNNLTEEEREKAFFAVISRMHKAEVLERRSYRGALYDVFGFEPGMYGAGMECGYLTMHNLLYDAADLQAIKSATRFEVIDDTGRAYTKFLAENQHIEFSLRDDNKTISFFIKAVDAKNLYL